MKKILLSVILALASVCSFADPVDLGTFNPLSGSWFYQGNYQQGPFDNQFSFSTNSTMTLDTAITSYWGSIGNFHSTLDGHALTDNQGILTLGAGKHIFDVQGDSPLYGSGYNTRILVAAVPEPETYVMLLAGLGLIGMIVRRRKIQN